MLVVEVMWRDALRNIDNVAAWF